MGTGTKPNSFSRYPKRVVALPGRIKAVEGELALLERCIR
jgi:hypothetical protein